jgi:hypothetical protein
VSDAELSPFENDADYKRIVIDLRELLKQLNRALKVPATDTAGFDDLTRMADRLRELLGKLPTNAPDDVKEFLAAATSKDGAPLALMTDSVRAWLHANSQTDRFRIRR